MDVQLAVGEQSGVPGQEGVPVPKVQESPSGTI